MRLLCVLALLWALAAPAIAQDFPPLTGRVVDAADVLSPRTEAALALRLADWEAESSDQVVVATVPDLGGLEIAEYGYRLGRAWGIGVDEGADGRALDNGAILLIAPNDRAVRIEVGYGLEGTLTDVRSREVVADMLPLLRAGDYDAAAVEGAAGIVSVLSGERAEAQARRQRAPDRSMATGAGEGGVPWPLLILLGFALFWVLPRRRRRRRGPVLFDSRPRGGDLATALILGQMMGGGPRGGLGGGGFSSGGFGAGMGGGFSGGGGSFGGGGASGSW